MSLIAHTSAGSAGGNTITTSAIDTTGATLIVVCVSETSGVINTPTDSKSNTYTPLTNRDTGASVAVRLFYCENPTAGSGHTFSYTHNSAFPAIAVQAHGGTLTASSLNTETGATGAAVTSIQPGSISPAAASDLFVTGLSFGASRVVSIDSSFTISDQVDYLSAGGNFGIGMAYKSSGTAENPTWSWTPALSPAVAMASFKEASGGAGPSSQATLTMLGVQ
jgi:hypothetical protein